MKKRILLLTFLLSGFLQAQITLVNPEPDFSTTLADPPGFAMNLFPIDLNNDGTPEYTFRWDDYTFDWYMHIGSVTPGDTNVQLATTSQFGMGNVVPFTAGTPINSSTTFYSSFGDPFIATATDSNFQGLGDRYVAFKAILNGSTYYGWILIEVVNKTLTIKEYAYTTNSAGLMAGEGGSLSIKELYKDSFIISPNPVSSYMNIYHSNFNTDSLHITLFDITGKLVLEQEARFGEAIHTEGLAEGHYVLKAVYKGLVSTKQLIVKRG